MKMTEEQIRELADNLRGTADPIDLVLERMGLEDVNFIDDHTVQELQAFDDMVMNCDTCGWWVDADEICGENGTECRDCCECSECSDE